MVDPEWITQPLTHKKPEDVSVTEFDKLCANLVQSAVDMVGIDWRNYVGYFKVYDSTYLVFKHHSGFVRVYVDLSYYFYFETLRGNVELVFGNDPTGQQTRLMNVEYYSINETTRQEIKDMLKP